jgi:glycosyltransferase involved in cell wall biosynthesis
MKTKGFAGESQICPLPLDPSIYRPRRDGKVHEILTDGSRGIPLIGYAGRIVKEKGLATLARALGMLKELEWKLVVIGAGPYESEFDEELRLAGVGDRVVRVGYISHDQTAKYLAALDVLVLPSETQPQWKEQFGRVLLEALACGTALAGSDSGEIPNLIRQSGGGLVFAERDPKACAGAIQTLLGNSGLRDSYSNKGRQWVLENVSLEAVAGKMVGTIERACRKTRTVGQG